MNAPFAVTASNNYDTMLAELGPKCWWKLIDLPGTGTIDDSSGNGWSGNVHGVVTFGEAGPLPGRTSALFDGRTGYIDTQAPAPNGAFSVVTWANFITGQDGFPDQYPYIAACMANERTNGIGLGIGFQANYGPINNIFFAVGTGSTQAEIDWYGIQHQPGWHFVVGTWDGAHTLNLYYDAINVGTKPLTSLVPGGLPWSLAANDGYDEGFDDFWPSGIADVAIFDFELTFVQISDLYTAIRRPTQTTSPERFP